MLVGQAFLWKHSYNRQRVGKRGDFLTVSRICSVVSSPTARRLPMWPGCGDMPPLSLFSVYMLVNRWDAAKSCVTRSGP